MYSIVIMVDDGYKWKGRTHVYDHKDWFVGSCSRPKFLGFRVVALLYHVLCMVLLHCFNGFFKDESLLYEKFGALEWNDLVKS